MIIIQIQNFYKKAVDFLDKNKEFSIYASDVMIIDAYGKQFRRANLKEDFVDSDFNDMLKGKAVLGHTTGSILETIILTIKL